MSGHYEVHGPWLRLEAFGLPVPQGSIRSLGAGRPSVHSNAARLKPWRELLVGMMLDGIIDDASRRIRLDPESPDFWPLTEPVAVDLTFTMPKPKSAPKTRRTFPVTRPDVDKLIRAVLDAGTTAGAWSDDSRVVQISARKVYPGEHAQALHVPGLVAYVYTVADAGRDAA